MIQPEHNTIRGLITYLNYRKDTGHSAARVDPDQEESWARQLELLLEGLEELENATPSKSRERIFKHMQDHLQDYRTRLLQLASVVGPQDEDKQFVIELGIERVEQELAWTQHIRNYFNKRDKISN